MTDTTQQLAAEIAGRYLAVWSEPDAAARRAAVAGLWQPDGVEFVDGGGYAVTSAGDVARYDDIVTFTVALSAPDGEVAWAARAFLVLGDDGRIREDYQLTVKALAA